MNDLLSYSGLLFVFLCLPLFFYLVSRPSDLPNLSSLSHSSKRVRYFIIPLLALVGLLVPIAGYKLSEFLRVPAFEYFFYLSVFSTGLYLISLLLLFLDKFKEHFLFIGLYFITALIYAISSAFGLLFYEGSMMSVAIFTVMLGGVFLFGFFVRNRPKRITFEVFYLLVVMFYMAGINLIWIQPT